MKELIDSKKSFKSAKESEAEENYGRAYAEYRHVSALVLIMMRRKSKWMYAWSAFESEILRLCEEQAYYKAISNTIDLMEELGISMPMSDDDTLGIDDCFCLSLNKWQNRVVLKMLKHQCKKTLQTDASMTISMI